MTRTLAIAAALLIALPTFASELAVKIELSDSLRAAVARGDVKVRVSAESNAYDAGESAPVVIRDVSPGKVKVRAFISTAHGTWVDDPKGLEVVVPRDGQAAVTLPVTSRMVSGSVALHGKPLRGDLHLFPSDPNRDNWGFAVPIDDAGKFFFPLPHGGAWDLQISWDNRKSTVQIPRYEFRDENVHIDLPEGANHLPSSYKYSTKDITAPSKP
jgi:hypothetical protein